MNNPTIPSSKPLNWYELTSTAHTMFTENRVQFFEELKVLEIYRGQIFTDSEKDKTYLTLDNAQDIKVDRRYSKIFLTKLDKPNIPDTDTLLEEAPFTLQRTVSVEATP